MELSLLGLWLVCGLGATVFAAVIPLRAAPALAFAAAFGATAWWSGDRLPNLAIAGIIAALAAARTLARPASRFLPATVAGALTGSFAGVLEQQGLPAPVALFVAAAVPCASAWLSMRRSVFAPATLRDEALLFICALGVGAAALPGVIDGWHAALNLNLQGGAPPTAIAIPLWVVTLTVMAAASGGLYSLWSRR